MNRLAVAVTLLILTVLALGIGALAYLGITYAQSLLAPSDPTITAATLIVSLALLWAAWIVSRGLREARRLDVESCLRQDRTEVYGQIIGHWTRVLKASQEIRVWKDDRGANLAWLEETMAVQSGVEVVRCYVAFRQQYDAQDPLTLASFGRLLHAIRKDLKLETLRISDDTLLRLLRLDDGADTSPPIEA